ncbi:MAG: hypothetical protein HC848_05355 [Limnobacter sp.]|nr:hypothetical protein [Limnobacter sp.]
MKEKKMPGVDGVGGGGAPQVPEMDAAVEAVKQAVLEMMGLDVNSLINRPSLAPEDGDDDTFFFGQ